ncbi:MAG: response regulator [Nitrospirota bacterium]|nr:MAG: response regulator [Nitrospirota bacterium]
MRKPRAIVFDDEEMVLSLFRDILEQQDFEVLIYSEPEVCPVYKEKDAECGKDKPCADVLITDLRMPGMNGIELLQKQTERGCLLTIKNKAVITADLSEENGETISDLGCGYIKKPFKLDEIRDWVTDCLKRVDLSKPVG